MDERSGGSEDNRKGLSLRGEIIGGGAKTTARDCLYAERASERKGAIWH